MAFDALDEHEQGELVRKWLRDNGSSILIGVGLGLLLIFGWQQWRAHQARHQAEAAVQYDAMTLAVKAKDAAAIGKGFELLKSDYADTAYAVFAAMQQAEAALGNGDKTAALAAATWAFEHAKVDALKGLAGLRLARLKLGEGDAQAALDIAGRLPRDGYAALIDELRGDALHNQGKNGEARDAYQSAVQALEAAAPNRASLEMKLNALGGSAEKKSS
jgi:predicted negative regulator of RcsB-dependent stress response